MPMKNPPHPGGFVLRECIEPLGLTITQAAAALGVTRTTLSELVNGKRGISPEMPSVSPKFSAAAPNPGSPSRPTTTSPTSAPPTSNSNAFNSPDRPRKRTRPNPQFRLAARLYTRPRLGVCETSRDPAQTGSLRTHAAANHSKRTGRRSVHAGPPAPDSFSPRHNYRFCASSFNLWRAIVLDYFTYCEVLSGSAHCDAQVS